MQKLTTLVASLLMIAALWVGIFYGVIWITGLKDVGLAFWSLGVRGYPFAAFIYILLHVGFIKVNSAFDKKNALAWGILGISYPIWPFLISLWNGVIH